MHVSLLGGDGFIGRKLAARLVAEPLQSLTLFDLRPPPAPSAPFPVTSLGGDIADLPPDAIPPGTDVVFHLAAVPSGAAEADYDLGRRANLLGTQAVIDACRRLARPPRVVFTSTSATFSAVAGEIVGDDTRQRPATTYGAHKAAAELCLADATRRGFLDAVSLRLPTILVRPGRPNGAASSFVSAIVREPLLGLATDLPVDPGCAIWVASPRRAVDWLLHAATLEPAAIGHDRSLNPPGMTVTVAEILAALEAQRPGAGALVRPHPDPRIAGIVEGWPAAFDTGRALALGFAPQDPLAAIVEVFVRDDLEPTRRERL